MDEEMTGTSYEKYTKIISTLCYIIQDNKVLMLYRHKKDAHNKDIRSYRGPGGKAEPGENPIECVIREVKEETGLTITPIWKGLITFTNTTGKDWESHVFTATEFTGELIHSPEGELHWVDKEQLYQLDQPEGDRRLLPYLFKDEKFHAHISYEDHTLVRCDVILL